MTEHTNHCNETTFKNQLNSDGIISDGKKISQGFCDNGCMSFNDTTADNNAFYSFEVINEIAKFLLKHTKIRPKIGIICGSGLNSLADHLTNPDIFPYESIPNFPISTVEGHIGRMIFGYLNSIPVVCMQGRFHYYEGYPLSKCSMPVRVMKLIGITHLIVTNAAGGVNPKFNIGDIMIIKDHINIMGITGHNPLQGPNDNRFGPRFLSMIGAYDKNLIKTARRIVKEMKIENNVHEGVFTCCGGPNYETIAEIKMLRSWGIDSVGMSTVHEVMTAKHCNIKAFAFSLITNCCPANYDSDNETNEANHEEVVEVGKSRETICGQFVKQMVEAINESEQNKL